MTLLMGMINPEAQTTCKPYSKSSAQNWTDGAPNTGRTSTLNGTTSDQSIHVRRESAWQADASSEEDEVRDEHDRFLAPNISDEASDGHERDRKDATVEGMVGVKFNADNMTDRQSNIMIKVIPYGTRLTRLPRLLHFLSGASRWHFRREQLLRRRSTWENGENWNYIIQPWQDEPEQSNSAYWNTTSQGIGICFLKHFEKRERIIGFFSSLFLRDLPERRA
ncbi:hypothetical protein F4806DRAFT_464561, partial [Annulohypoxylon nitens]